MSIGPQKGKKLRKCGGIGYANSTLQAGTPVLWTSI